MLDLTNRTIGQYEILTQLGAGGMAVVYRALDQRLQRHVAFKVLSVPPAASRDEYEDRFRREAKTIATLEHSHIVPVYDHDVRDGISYVVMRLLSGGTLDEKLKQRKQDNQTLATFNEMLSLLEQVASALDYAHSRNVIHRDIKPTNIMFSDQDVAFVVDFGIAKVLGETTEYTNTGRPIGTPAFMPPEQWQAESLTPAADQYALAIVAYYMLTNRLPFAVHDSVAMMYAHLEREPDPQPTLSPQMYTVIRKAMAKKPHDRYGSVLAFVDALRTAASEQDDLNTLLVSVTSTPSPYVMDSPPMTRPETLAASPAIEPPTPVVESPLPSHPAASQPSAFAKPAQSPQLPEADSELERIRKIVGRYSPPSPIAAPPDPAAIGSPTPRPLDSRPKLPKVITGPAVSVRPTLPAPPILIGGVVLLLLMIVGGAFALLDGGGNDDDGPAGQDRPAAPAVTALVTEVVTEPDLGAPVPTDLPTDPPAVPVVTVNVPTSVAASTMTEVATLAPTVTPTSTRPPTTTPTVLAPAVTNTTAPTTAPTVAATPTDIAEITPTNPQLSEAGGDDGAVNFPTRVTATCILTPQGVGVNIRTTPSTTASTKGTLAEPQPAIGATIGSDGYRWYQVAAGWVRQDVVNVGADCHAFAYQYELINNDALHASIVAAFAAPARNADWTPFLFRLDAGAMALVPAGCVEIEGFGDASSSTVCIDEPFWMDIYEVTNADFGGVGCSAISGEPDQPRNCVTWQAARDHCERRGGALPTEAQWVLAASGPSQWRFPWGDTYVVGNAVIGAPQPDAVGSVPDGRSWVGVHDLEGNVWEWTATLYSATAFPDPYVLSDGRNDTRRTDLPRVVRGGAYTSAFNISGSGRATYMPNETLNDVGFRCVLPINLTQ